MCNSDSHFFIHYTPFKVVMKCWLYCLCCTHISLWLMYFRHRSWFQLPTDLKSICFMFNSDSTTFTEHLWVLVCIISGVLIHHLSFGYKGVQEQGGGPRKGSGDQGSSDVLPPCSEYTPSWPEPLGLQRSW